MCEINNVGYIYKITNLVNNKIYIGQTCKTIEQRWYEHKVTAGRKTKESYNYPLYKAIRKYGVENFNIEEIEKCEINNLDEREIYWISFYDSYNEGYNQTLGGGGTKFLEIDELEVINKYKELKIAYKVAEYFNCSSAVIRNVLKKHKIEVTSAEELAKEKGNIIKRFSLDGTFLEEYQTLREAGRWVVKEGLSSCNNDYSESLKIRRCIEYKESYLNFLWKSDNYEVKEKQIKIGDLNKEEFKSLVKVKSFKDICEEYNTTISTIQKYCKQYLIPYIEKDIVKISDENWEKECNLSKEEYQSKYKFIFHDSTLNPTKDELIQLVREKSFNEIGRIYKVNGNSVKKWCKKYLIPYKREDIDNIPIENWEKECNLSKEEYEFKYCIKKEKNKLNEMKVINTYKKLKSIRSTAKEFKADTRTIKKILKENNIKIFKERKNSKESLGKVYRCDKETGEILETYNSMIEAVDWLYENNTTEAKRESLKKSISKAVNSVHNAYGYKWKRA